MGVRLELDPECVRLHHGDGQVPGLELARRHVTPPLPERQPEDLAIELGRCLVVPGRHRDEVDAVDQLCLSGHAWTIPYIQLFGNPACGAGASAVRTWPVRGPFPTSSV